MLEAIFISVIVAIVLSLIAICVVKIIDAHEDKREQVKSDLQELGAENVIRTKQETSDVVVGKSRNKKAEDSIRTRSLGLGFAGIGIFGVIATRLAGLQLFNQESYQKAANDNQFTTVSTPAARGRILDRHKRVLAYSKTVQAITADKDVVNDMEVMRRLSAVLGIPVGIIRKRINNATSGAQSRRVVSQSARDRDVAFILEHSSAFPGIFIESRSIRTYPYGGLGAHVIGYTGYPTNDEVKNTSDKNLSLDDTIGKSGIEKQYNSLLSGDKGQRDIRVDADGNIVEIKSEISPIAGSDIVLSIDAHAQYVADSALRESILAEKGSTGAIVCLDVSDGSVVVMSSFPTYDPNAFVNGIPQETWDLYSKEESQAPMLNRAVSSEYAPGSTMKAFSAMAGLAYGYASYSTTYNCTGEWDGWNSGLIQKCWNTKGHGKIDLHEGIVVSCDTVFYEIGKQFFDHGSNGTKQISDTALQEYYEKFGFGSKTNIDLQDETDGLVPTPQWKAERWRNVPSEAIWSGGDYTNMIIGQGNLLVTPLQLAYGYCGIATKKQFKPHLLKAVQNSNRETVLTSDGELVHDLDIDEGNLAFVNESLRDMVKESKVISKLFDNAGIEAAGKTGTAEHTAEIPDALFVAYAPYDNPKYVCASVLQHGNSGEQNASELVVKTLKAVIDSDGNSELEVGFIAGYAGEELLDGHDASISVRND